jgi:hypothetical protein
MLIREAKNKSTTTKSQQGGRATETLSLLVEMQNSTANIGSFLLK